MPKVRMWKVTHRKGFDDEYSTVSLDVRDNGKVFLTGGPVWIMPFATAQSVFMNKLEWLPEDGTPVEIKLAVEPL